MNDLDDQINNFNKIFGELGGFFDFTLENEKEKVIYQDGMDIIIDTMLYLESFFKELKIKLPTVQIAVINSPLFNATAANYNGEYYIGFNKGAFLIIWDMCNNFFSTKSFGEKIGDINMESGEKQVLNASLFTFLNRTGLGYNDIFPTSTPNDPSRNYLAKEYFAMAVRFLALHEIGHLLCGHLGFLSSLHHTTHWSELYMEKNLSKQLPPWISQTLEMDADSFASSLSFRMVFDLINGLTNSIYKKQQPYVSYHSFFVHWSTVIYSFFRLFQYDNPDFVKAVNSSHPPALVRIVMVISNIEPILKMHKIDNFEELRKIAVNVMEVAEEVFSAITFHDNKFESFINSFGECQKYSDIIINNWNKVRPLLTPFSLINLPSSI